jgi:hypothetical protein
MLHITITYRPLPDHGSTNNKQEIMQILIAAQKSAVLNAKRPNVSNSVYAVAGRGLCIQAGHQLCSVGVTVRICV